MHTLLLLTSGTLVTLWVLATAFSLDFIRHLEARRHPVGGLHLMRPSAWQAVTA
jgi:hypothetical protein